MKLSPILLLAAALALLTGCQTYTGQTETLTSNWLAGNYPAAAAEADAEATKRATSRDALIWWLEAGAVHRVNGTLAASNDALERAEQEAVRYENEARLTVSREAAAVVTNLATLPYEGMAYDKIMMNVYKALNHMQLGDLEKARVELNRALQRQREAAELNSKRIEKAKASAQGGKTEDGKDAPSVDVDRAQQDPRLATALQANYGTLEGYRSYGDYVNPFAEWLQAVYFMAQAVDGSDLERARKSFERVYGLVGEHAYIMDDLRAIGGRLQGERAEPVTYVIFETGRAPVRREFRVDIPTFIDRSPYAGANFPRLEEQGDFVANLRVTTEGGQAYDGMLLADMDSVVAREFKNQLPYIITRTIVATVVKAALAYAVNQAVDNSTDDGWMKVAARIATSIGQAALNQADLRTWTTLPKQFHLVRLPTPANRALTLNAGFSPPREVLLQDGGTINVVYVRSVTTSAPLVVSQFTL